MIAIGTVIQRADLVQDYFGSETSVVLNPDIVDARANRLLRIDVLQNDEGVAAADRKDLKLVSAPDCGRVFVQGEALQFLPDASCVGEQRIQYSLDGRDDVIGEVVARMHSADGERLVAEASTTEAPKETTDPAALTVAEAKPTAPVQPEETTVAATEIPQKSQPQTELVVAKAAEQDADDDGSLTSVVGSLIQGTAQPAQAGVASVEIDERRAAFERQAEAERLAAVERQAEVNRQGETEGAAQIGLAPQADLESSSEPSVGQIEVAALGTPEGNQDQRVAVPGASTGKIVRGDEAPAVSTAQQPDPTTQVRPEFTELLPTIERIDPGGQKSFVADDSFDLAKVIGADKSPTRAVPYNSRQGGSEFLVAVIERSEPSTVPPAAPSLFPAGDLAAIGAPSGTVPLVEGSDTQIALADPVQEVARPDGSLNPALNASPVDSKQLPLDPNPVIMSIIPPLKPSMVGIGTVTDPEGNGGSRPSVTGAPAGLSNPSAEKLAALPQTDAPCVIPPAMTIDVRRAARSIVSVDAPCHANTIAELQYSGLRFAVPLDETGKGALTALGFEPNAPALLSFVNGEKIDFDLPFKGIDKVSRIAVAWDVPVQLELNAIEFDGSIGGPDHVHPENPRGFSDVRRTGGGFLDSYRGYAGVGQNVQVYTFWHRKGGRHGVVELMIDFASRNRDRLEGTCGDGIFAAPNFLVLRSEDGRLERPVIRKLAAVECSSIAKENSDKRLISGAVSDLVVLKR